jgi:oligo-1,6-glucosidase
LASGSIQTTRAIIVEQALADPNSLFYYYQRLIRLRAKYSVVVYGKYDLILESHKEMYAFTRILLDERLLVILNFSPQNLRLSEFRAA